MTFTLAQLKAVAAFCRTHGAPHYYRDWSPLVLLEYLNFHAQQDTLQVVATGETIQGVATAHRVAAPVIAQARAAGKPVFDWTPDDPAAPNLLLGHFIGAERGALAALVRCTQARFPNWERLNVFALRTTRGGRQHVRYSVQTIRRLARGNLKEHYA